jgi:hypothetical protein
MKTLLKRFGLLSLFAVTGLTIPNYFEIPCADVAVLLKVVGMLSVFLIIIGMALDDRKGKGLFPSYDEGELMSLIYDTKSPIAASIVIGIKNFVLALIFVLAVLFVKP